MTNLEALSLFVFGNRYAEPQTIAQQTGLHVAYLEHLDTYVDRLNWNNRQEAMFGIGCLLAKYGKMEAVRREVFPQYRSESLFWLGGLLGIKEKYLNS